MPEPHDQSQARQHVCPAARAGWLTISIRTWFNNPKRILKGLVREGDTAADLGCGPGFFTLPLAQKVGESGRVIAVDVQQEMLDQLRARAEAAGLATRINLLHSLPDRIGAVGPVDFALAFWMLHEVPEQDTFLREVRAMLGDSGHFLLVEPAFHVSEAAFLESVKLAERVGLKVVSRPRVGLSRAALFG